MKTSEKIEGEIRPLEYNGIETWEEQITQGKFQTITRKINMTTSELNEFLGGHDPKKYFKGGKVPVSQKSIGKIMDEDSDEVKNLRMTMPEFKDVLLFKHKFQSLYTLLIPKSISEFELDSENEIVGEYFTADTRSICFGATGTPNSYEKTFFKKKLLVVYKALKNAYEAKGLREYNT